MDKKTEKHKKIPLVSVILPTYNRSHLLPRAIKSVLSQTFKDFELIIVDDGSTDNTEKVIKSISDKRIIYLKNNKNLGIIKSLNRGLRVAKGKYIARIDDDDIWCDMEKLEKQINFLNENPDYTIVGGGAIMINQDGKELFRYYRPKTDYEIRKTMLFKCPLIHTAVVFRKKKAEEVGFYSDFYLVEDWELFMKLGRVGKFYNFPECLIKHLIHKNNITTAKNLPLYFRNGIKIIKLHKNDYPNYFKALIYNYIKLLLFSLPFFYYFFMKFLSIKNKKT